MIQLCSKVFKSQKCSYKSQKSQNTKNIWICASPLPDLSLSVSRLGEALFTHYKKFFGILREFNHETNFSTQSIFPSLCLLNYQPETYQLNKWVKELNKNEDIMNDRFLATETNSKALYIFHCFLTQPHQ